MLSIAFRTTLSLSISCLVIACAHDSSESARNDGTVNTTGTERTTAPANDIMTAPLTSDTDTNGTPEQTDVETLISTLPEVAAWSQFIAEESGGTAHGATMVDRDHTEQIDGKEYIAVGFYENHPDHTNRWETFLVDPGDSTILVDDVQDGVMTLEQWRHEKKPMERIRR